MSRNKKNYDHLVDNYGNYGVNISEGLWPGSQLDSKGEEGDKGLKGEPGGQGARGLKGFKGDKGSEGNQGLQGEDGKSQYELALEHGFVGSEVEWLESLKGEEGEKGTPGASPYDIWLLAGNTGDFDDYLDSIKGEKGDEGAQGIKGAPGGLFTFQGQQPDYNTIINLPGPHEKGDVIQDGNTDDLWVWDGTQWVLLTEAVSVLKGEQGDNGKKGDKGEEGLAITGPEGKKGDPWYSWSKRRPR